MSRAIRLPAAGAVPSRPRVRWYAVSPCEPERFEWDEGALIRTRSVLVPRNGSMADAGWGWEVICACGWESRTGGGVRSWVRRLLDEHMAAAHGQPVVIR